MSKFVPTQYDAQAHRLAAPLRAAQTRTLVDAPDQGALEALLATTSNVERHRAGEIAIVASEDDYVG